MNIINVSDIVEDNGLTVRENNMAMTHTIALGTLVEIKQNEYEDGLHAGVRLFVVNHSRDCDGTPLYDLSFDKEAQVKYEKFLEAVKNGEFNDPQYGHGLRLISDGMYRGSISRHFSLESLEVISG